MHRIQRICIWQSIFHQSIRTSNRKENFKLSIQINSVDCWWRGSHTRRVSTYGEGWNLVSALSLFIIKLNLGIDWIRIFEWNYMVVWWNINEWEICTKCSSLLRVWHSVSAIFTSLYCKSLTNLILVVQLNMLD